MQYPQQGKHHGGNAGCWNGSTSACLNRSSWDRMSFLRFDMQGFPRADVKGWRSYEEAALSRLRSVRCSSQQCAFGAASTGPSFSALGARELLQSLRLRMSEVPTVRWIETRFRITACNQTVKFFVTLGCGVCQWAVLESASFHVV